MRKYGLEYIGNAGQTYQPFKMNTGIPVLSYKPLEKPNPPLKDFVLASEYEKKGYIIQSQNQHFLPGVTAEMLDWWWANMEKGYYLWAPGSHKSFRWLKEPWKYGLVHSQHMISETFAVDAPVFGGNGMIINRLDMDLFPLTDALKHVICEGTYNESGELADETIHMWENIDGGCNHVKIKIMNRSAKEPPIFIKEMLMEDLDQAKEMLGTDRSWHGEYETARWPVFLPKLYHIWKDHPDPSQNVHCNLEIEKRADGTFRYIEENAPIMVRRK